MNKFRELIMKKSQKIRNKLFERPAKFLISKNVKANYITFLSLILGILAVVFLFENYYLFILFILLHFLADAFDGVLARLAGTTTFGAYFDYLTDQLVTLLILGKIALLLNDYYVYIIIAIFLVTVINYCVSRMKAPIIFHRTTIMIIMAFNFYPFNYYLNIPVVAYLVIGVLALYTLTIQFRYWLKK